jgi:FtsH-binding integral membrane protein
MHQEAPMQLMSATRSQSVLDGAPVLEALGIDARLDFLRKTYALFTVGVGLCAVGAYVGVVTPVGAMFGGVSPWLFLIGFIALQFGIYAVARVPVVNVVAMLTYTFLYGLLLSNLIGGVLAQQGLRVGGINIATAFVGTALGFVGLSVYAMLSRKDFSFLGGFLAVFFLGSIGLVVFGMIFGLSPGMWIVYDGAAVVAGGACVLYTTSNILRYYSERDWVLAAIALFIDFVYIFVHLLRLLSQLSNERR